MPDEQTQSVDAVPVNDWLRLFVACVKLLKEYDAFMADDDLLYPDHVLPVIDDEVREAVERITAGK